MGRSTALSGFTLIELLISVSLLGLVVLGATSLFFATLKGGQKADIHTKIKQDGYYALNVMRTKIRNAQNVDCNSVITVNNSDGSSNEFDLSGDQITQDGQPITSEDFTLTNPIFDCPSPSPNQPQTVDFSFTLSSPGGGESQTFETAVSLRTY